ncbi:MAG: hypothetical protein KKA62_02875 [Nanoarchaeota archaeon]|nr:hypothetical protein [Nanoarchaeota archaeon]MBU1644598.1 hypothetical protein [Nanoarchaeota archaeon]MBU1976874.1 hypothetical protein [Nanoarchaeota archaeon]
MFDLFNIYQQPAGIVVVLVLLSVWTVVWKGLALWHSARNNQNAWFVVMLVLNTMGLLPIIYLIWFRPKNKSVPKASSVSAVVKRVVKKPTTRRVVKKKVTKKK